jgi:hypothetical protein
MYLVSDHAPAYIHSIDGNDLPDWMYDLLRADSMDHDWKMLDYCDGDWKYKLDLKIVDPTPVSELVKFHEGEKGYNADSYPFQDWHKKEDSFRKYIGMLLIIHHVRDNVDADIIAANLLAVSI